MIYCGFSKESDVKLIHEPFFGKWTCRKCLLTSHYYDIFLRTITQVRNHLGTHVAAGHSVPERAMRQVMDEIEQYGLDWNGEEPEIETERNRQ